MLILYAEDEIDEYGFFEETLIKQGKQEKQNHTPVIHAGHLHYGQ
jgi:hypothetical protein